jgi:glycerophosphoryl diester phosphodiesterase
VQTVHTPPPEQRPAFLPKDHKRPRKLYAHRGAAAERPENTLPAFHRALDLGANALEMDVHLTADGHVVVSHDPTGTRMAGVTRAIRDTTLSAVSEWDAGYGFIDAKGKRPFAAQGYRIPTLEQVLIEFPGVQLNVDLKPRTLAIVPIVLKLLERHRAQERVLLASFETQTLREVRTQGYQGPTGLGRSEVARLCLLPSALLHHWWPLRGTAAQLPRNVGRLRLDTASMVARCHTLGLRLDYWTVNHPDDAQRLLALGADGIMTDDPAAIAPVFRH